MEVLESSHPLFEVVRTSAGAISIRNKELNETMHNPVGPWVEANTLYIDQSKLVDRLLEKTSDELVIFDVGLGAAANALAALAAANRAGHERRPLHIVSFERELELLRFALAQSAHFPHFFGYEVALETLLARGIWVDGSITWELRHGDFLDFIAHEKVRPHLVFFDPYSSKVNEEMWTTDVFRKIHALSRSPEEGGTSLFTYSQATRIRVALIAAGFYVGYGSATGLKSETTEASTDRNRLRMPLGKPWFDRWRKSHLRHPYDCRPEDEPGIDAAIEAYLLREFG